MELYNCQAAFFEGVWHVYRIEACTERPFHRTGPTGRREGEGAKRETFPFRPDSSLYDTPRRPAPPHPPRQLPYSAPPPSQ